MIGSADPTQFPPPQNPPFDFNLAEDPSGYVSCGGVPISPIMLCIANCQPPWDFIESGFYIICSGRGYFATICSCEEFGDAMGHWSNLSLSYEACNSRSALEHVFANRDRAGK